MGMKTWICLSEDGSGQENTRRQPHPFSIATRGGRFQLDAENSPSFQNVGMVSGAVFSDLNGDGYPDLALACEWGSIRVFLNERGRFKEATEKLGLNQFKGWWNGVSTGDFDGDGRLDIVGSNWGRNSRYESHRAQPLRSTTAIWTATAPRTSWRLTLT